MYEDWDILPEAVQLALAREALRRATETVASQAEILAQEMEAGSISDRGGTEALRLLAAIVRLTGQDSLGAVGHA
jgi:hypothetical protein